MTPDELGIADAMSRVYRKHALTRNVVDLHGFVGRQLPNADGSAWLTVTAEMAQFAMDAAQNAHVQWREEYHLRKETPNERRIGFEVLT